MTTDDLCPACDAPPGGPHSEGCVIWAAQHRTHSMSPIPPKPADEQDAPDGPEPGSDEWIAQIERELGPEGSE